MRVLTCRALRSSLCSASTSATSTTATKSASTSAGGFWRVTSIALVSTTSKEQLLAQMNGCRKVRLNGQMNGCRLICRQMDRCGHKTVVARLSAELSLSETKGLKCIPTLIVVCRCSLHAVVITKTKNPESKILGAPVCRQCCISSCLARVKAGVTLPACKVSAQNDVCPDQADVKPCILFVPHLQWGC